MSLSDEDEYELNQIGADTEEYQERVMESEHGFRRRIPGKIKVSFPVRILIFIIFILTLVLYFWQSLIRYQLLR